MDKLTVVQYIGKGSQAKTAARLGYRNVQMVYNWPDTIHAGLLDAIKLRMAAKRIAIPKEWGKRK